MKAAAILLILAGLGTQPQPPPRPRQGNKISGWFVFAAGRVVARWPRHYSQPLQQRATTFADMIYILLLQSGGTGAL
jgi:hypothetical protein